MIKLAKGQQPHRQKICFLQILGQQHIGQNAHGTTTTTQRQAQTLLPVDSRMTTHWGKNGHEMTTQL